MSDTWLPTWPGSESTVLLAIANHLITNDLYDKEFVRRWVNWQETLAAVRSGKLAVNDSSLASDIKDGMPSYEMFDRLLKDLYAEFTFERAAEEAQVPIERIREAARLVVTLG